MGGWGQIIARIGVCIAAFTVMFTKRPKGKWDSEDIDVQEPEQFSEVSERGMKEEKRKLGI